MVDHPRSGDRFLMVVLAFSIIHLGASIAVTLDCQLKLCNAYLRNADKMNRCSSIAAAITAGTAIFGSLSGFYGVLTIGIFSLVASHRCFLPRSKRTLSIAAIATTGASVVLAGAGIESLECVIHSETVVNDCLAHVPYSQSLILLLFSFVINAVLFFISLHFWRRRRKDEMDH